MSVVLSNKLLIITRNAELVVFTKTIFQFLIYRVTERWLYPDENIREAELPRNRSIEKYVKVREEIRPLNLYTKREVCPCTFLWGFRYIPTIINVHTTLNFEYQLTQLIIIFIRYKIVKHSKKSSFLCLVGILVFQLENIMFLYR